MKHRSLGPKLSLALVVAALGILFAPDSSRAVVVPMAFGLLLATGFFMILHHRSLVAPLAEIGTWFVGAVTVYLVLPLAVYISLGYEYTVFNDNRLAVIQPSPSQMGGIAWLYVIFLASFAVTYLAVRGQAQPPRAMNTTVPRQTIGIMMGLWVGINLFAALVVPTVAADSYAGGYLAVQQLPLGIRQIMKLWAGWGIVVTMGLRIWLFQDFQRKKWIILAWLAYDLFVAFTAFGSRTGVILSVGSSFLLYHFFVRPVRVRTALLAGSVGLVGFLGLGVFRAFQSIGAAQFIPASAGGEFESLFGNAVDLSRLVASGEIGSLPLSFHLADLIAVFPSQILPFEKLDPAAWYVTTFYPISAEMGGGLAFGVISQGIVGLGWVELVVRGAALGAVFARLHRFFSSNTHRFWVVTFYIWTTVWAYQSFRDQSFILTSYAIQQFLTLMLVVEGSRRILSRKPVTVHPQAVRAGSPLSASIET